MVFTSMGLATLSGLAWIKRKKPTYRLEDVQSLEIAEVVQVNRTETIGQYDLAWASDLGRVQVYATDLFQSPAQARLLTEVDNSQQARVSVPTEWKRPLFYVYAPTHARAYMGAERLIQLEGAVNFRDLGGFRTTSGKQIRYGQLYRTGALGKLTNLDLRTLTALGIRYSCDLRSRHEATFAPDRLPPTTRYLPIHVEVKVGWARQLMELLRYRDRMDEFMQVFYTEGMLEHNANVVRDVFSMFAEAQNYPLLFHCTAGKDRTGVTAALLLKLLGVDDDTILADYSFSHRYHAVFAQMGEDSIKALKRVGMTQAHLAPMFGADPLVMRAMLDYLTKRYGTVEAYLAHIGISAHQRTQIREHLLMEPATLAQHLPHP